MRNTRPHALLPRLVAAAAWLVAAWVCFTFAFTPLRASTDEFWHLKTGQWIAEHGLPEHDIYTYTAADYPWHNHEWLTQIAMWKIYSAGEAGGFGGWRAVIAWKTLMIILAFAGLGWAIGRRMEQPIWAVLAAVLAVALARRTFYPRPPFVTYFLLALLLWMLVEWRAGRLRERWLWLLVPLYALWANLHGGWMAGLVVCSAFWADAAWGVVRSRARAGERRAADQEIGVPGTPRTREEARRLGRLTLIGLACLFATLANPYGWHLYELAGNVTRDAYLLRSIGELKPPDPRFVVVLRGIFATLAVCAGVLWSAPADGQGQWTGFIHRRFLGGLVLATMIVYTFQRTELVWLQAIESWVVVGLVLWRLRPPGAHAHALVIGFFAYQGIYHVRHLPLLAIVMLPTLAWTLQAAARVVATRLPRFAVALAGSCLLLALAGWWTLARASWRPILTRPLGPLNVFAGLERDSYWDRNMMLIRGRVLQPIPYSPSPAQETDLKLGSWLRLSPRRFMIEPYPVGAMDWLIKAKLPGRLWTYGNMSGYFIWRLAPEHYMLFTDNRYDIFGGDFIRQEHAVLNGWTEDQLREAGATREEGFYPWNEVLDRWQVQTVILPVEAAARLGLRPAWEKVYGDFHVDIWVRRTPENEAAITQARTLPRPQPWIVEIQ